MADSERKREAKAVVDAQARARRTKEPALEPQPRATGGGFERALRIVRAVSVAHAARTGNLAICTPVGDDMYVCQ